MNEPKSRKRPSEQKTKEPNEHRQRQEALKRRATKVRLN